MHHFISSNQPRLPLRLRRPTAVKAS